MKRNKILFIAVTFFIFMFLVVLIPELILRVIWDGKERTPNYTPESPYYPNANEEIGFTLKPDYNYKHLKMKTNSEGFRINREITHLKSDEVYRVVCLGDSVMQGYNTYFRHTIPSLLSDGLNHVSLKGYKRAEVLNFGISGYNMTQYLAVLKEYGLKYQPDMVVAGITIFNDFDGYFMTYLDKGFLGAMAVDNIHGYNYRLTAPSKAFWRSYLFRFLYMKFTDTWENRHRGPVDHGGKHKYIRKRLAASCDSDDPIWERTAGMLDEMKELSQKHDFKLIFLIIPTREQVVYDDLPRAPQNILKKLLEERDLSYVDYFDDFLSTWKTSKHLPYRDNESHPDNTMNDFIAKSVRDRIMESVGQTTESGTGEFNLGFAKDWKYLSYGWDSLDRKGKRRYRWIINNQARLVFPGFRNNVSLFRIKVKKFPECDNQLMTILLNGKKIFSHNLSGNDDFMTFDVSFPSVIKLTDSNRMDFSFSCARLPSNQMKKGKNKKTTPKVYTAAVDKIILK